MECVLWSDVCSDDLIVLSGGMPRASYSDRNTVTIQQGSNKHVVLDFTSKVIDFFVTYNVDNDGNLFLFEKYARFTKRRKLNSFVPLQWEKTSYYSWVPVSFNIYTHLSCTPSILFVEWLNSWILMRNLEKFLNWNSIDRFFGGEEVGKLRLSPSFIKFLKKLLLWGGISKKIHSMIMKIYFSYYHSLLYSELLCKTLFTIFIN